MADVVEREKIQEVISDIYKDADSAVEGACIEIWSRVKEIPAADVVSCGAYDQTDWERCVALTQLKEIGKGLGERMDDVRPVVMCRDCKHGQGEKMDFWNEYEGIECIGGVVHRKDWFCADGEKREES